MIYFVINALNFTQTYYCLFFHSIEQTFASEVCLCVFNVSNSKTRSVHVSQQFSLCVYLLDLPPTYFWSFASSSLQNVERGRERVSEKEDLYNSSQFRQVLSFSLPFVIIDHMMFSFLGFSQRLWLLVHPLTIKTSCNDYQHKKCQWILQPVKSTLQVEVYCANN